MTEVLTALAVAPAGPGVLAFALLAVLAAGMVRGFTGFGFSAVSVACLSFVLPPATLIPAIFLLEVLASVGLVREGWRDADRGWLARLLAGTAVGLPLGMAALGWLPARSMQLALGVGLLALALGLRAVPRLVVPAGRSLQLAAGAASGAVTGAAAVGGLLLAMVMQASALGPAAMRGTMILLFLASDLYALALAGLLDASGLAPNALLELQTLAWAVWLALPCWLGIRIGRRGFGRSSPQVFRRRVLDLLMLLAGVGAARALFVAMP